MRPCWKNNRPRRNPGGKSGSAVNEAIKVDSGESGARETPMPASANLSWPEEQNIHGALRYWPVLLVSGMAPNLWAVQQSLQHGNYLDDAEILIEPQIEQLPSRLDERRDIGVILILWADADFDRLIRLVESLFIAQDRTLKAILVRCPVELPAAVKATLWHLGVADLAFQQEFPSAALSDSVAVTLRQYTRNRSLLAVSAAAGSFSDARTLHDLAQLALQVVHEQGVGRQGGLFCFLGSSAEPRTVVVAGTGKFSRYRAVPLDSITDTQATKMVSTAMRHRQCQFASNALAVPSETPDGHFACIFLSLMTQLNPWKQEFVRTLAKTVAISIDQTQMAHRLMRTQHATIATMATLAEFRDVDTGEHVARVARAATEIAVALLRRGGMPEIDDSFIEQIGLASILHDVGKIAIPESILLKPGPLDFAERLLMQEHVKLGQEILLRAARRSDNGELLRKAAEIARHHHEKYDGSGYPTGLKGREIPLSARIVALVDVFDALISIRPYKKAWPVEEAVDYIRAQSGLHFDPVVVEEFLLLEERKKSARCIEWSEGMSVGHPDLDLDHQRLIAVINRLGSAESQCNRQTIEFILDDLVNYTEFHFKREETILELHDYPDLARHRAIHNGFCRKLEELRWEYFQGIRDEPDKEILLFLTQWLNTHILEEDMSYRSWI